MLEPKPTENGHLDFEGPGFKTKSVFPKKVSLDVNASLVIGATRLGRREKSQNL